MFFTRTFFYGLPSSGSPQTPRLECQINHGLSAAIPLIGPSLYGCLIDKPTAVTQAYRIQIIDGNQSYWIACIMHVQINWRKNPFYSNCVYYDRYKYNYLCVFLIIYWISFKFKFLLDIPWIRVVGEGHIKKNLTLTRIWHVSSNRNLTEAVAVKWPTVLRSLYGTL